MISTVDSSSRSIRELEDQYFSKACEPQCTPMQHDLNHACILSLVVLLIAIPKTVQVVLACPACIDEGKPESCVHLLHLVPEWQSSTRHTRLKTIMVMDPEL